MSVVDIVTIVIGGITIFLLLTLLVMMRTTYVLVRREGKGSDAPYPNDPTTTSSGT